jgi:uncharacterized oxidoreductase
MNITGNTIFIPGATSGIGLALALRLKERGNTVIIGGRRTSLLSDLAQVHGFDTVRIDTADAASIAKATADVVSRFPDLNVLVAMAGITRQEDWTTPGFLADAEETVVTNVLGPIRLIDALVPQLRGRPGATIVTVSSGLAHTPLRFTPTYNATKAAIHQLSESIRMQLAPIGIQVTELVPPAVRTALMPGHDSSEHAMPLEAYVDEVMALLEADPEAHEVLVEQVKLLRYAEVRGDYDQIIGVLNTAEERVR